MTTRLQIAFRAAIFAVISFGLPPCSAPPLSLAGQPFVVEGLVRSREGPIPTARVWVINSPVRFETETDEHGFFRLALPALGSGREPAAAWFGGLDNTYQADHRGIVRCWKSEQGIQKVVVGDRRLAGTIEPPQAGIPWRCSTRSSANWGSSPRVTRRTGSFVPESSWIWAPAPSPGLAALLSSRLNR